MTQSAPDSLVILLHGVGSRGDDIAGLASAWSDFLPSTAFAAPNAPQASSFGSGYQWFSVSGVTEGNRPGRIIDARASFDATISAILEEHGFVGKLDRVAFVGFSQGTIMALDAIASGRWPVAGVVGYSGRLASPAPLDPSKETSVLLIHGDADGVMPVGLTDAAATTLRSHGMSVETHIIAGAGHTITGKGVELGASFLADLFRR
jgi:phospholipase/carboxylesterase